MKHYSNFMVFFSEEPPCSKENSGIIAPVYNNSYAYFEDILFLLQYIQEFKKNPKMVFLHIIILHSAWINNNARDK